MTYRTTKTETKTEMKTKTKKKKQNRKLWKLSTTVKVGYTRLCHSVVVEISVKRLVINSDERCIIFAASKILHISGINRSETSQHKRKGSKEMPIAEYCDVDDCNCYKQLD